MTDTYSGPAGVGTPFTAAGTFTDPGQPDTFENSTVDYGDNTGPQALTLGGQGTFTVAAHHYLEPGDYVADVTIKDDDTGASASTEISRIPVTAVRVGDLTVTDSVRPYNFVTVAGLEAATTTLYVVEDDTGLATIDLALAATPNRPDVMGHLLWKVTGPTVVNAAAGNFGQEVKVTLDAATEDSEFLVEVGFDDNGDGALSSTEASRSAKVKPVNADLDAKKVGPDAAGVLTEPEEDGTGAFVPVNNDDDDYSVKVNDPGSDLDQKGAVVGENDLLPIIVRGRKYGGQYKFASQLVKIYEDAGRANEAAPTFEVPQADRTFYVEGRAAGAGFVKMDWIKDGKIHQDVERVKITVFNWVGPLNVPEHAVYQYTVTTQLPADAKWVEPTGGAIAEGGGTKDVKVKWGAGPVVGKANFRVDANYTWGLEVNVVEVKVEKPDVGDAFTPAAQGVEGAVFGGNDTLLGPVKPVASGAPGLEWKAKVTLNGPNGDRGVAQMRVGFIQNATITKLRATYDAIAGERVHGMQDQTVFDADPGAASRPWFKIDDAALFSDPSPTKKAKTIGWNDTPRMEVPVRGVKAQRDQNLITRLDLVFDFDLFVAAATIDARNDADNVHAKQASARWQWDGSQAIGAAATDHRWNAAVSKVTAPAAWTEENNGTQPKKDGPLGNTEIAKAGYWNTNWAP